MEFSFFRHFRSVSTFSITVLFLSQLSHCGDAKPTPFHRDVNQPLKPVGSNPDMDTEPTPGTNEEFPDSPIELPRTGVCFPNEEGEYSEVLALDKGKLEGDEGNYSWSEGGGCIGRSLSDVWVLMHDHQLIYWEDVDSVVAQSLPPPADVSHFYRVEYTVRDFITVRWIMDWYHSLTEGSLSDPRKVVINYQRVSGTRYIPYWEGSIVLEHMGDALTSFSMVNRIRATRTGPDEAAGAIRDLFVKLRDTSIDSSESLYAGP